MISQDPIANARSVSVVKVKFRDFRITAAQRAAGRVESQIMRELLLEAWARGEGKPVRLIGTGVRFRSLALSRKGGLRPDEDVLIKPYSGSSRLS